MTSDDRKEDDDAPEPDSNSDDLGLSGSAVGASANESDDVGAYLLDALSESERADFEDRLADSLEIQAELASLAPVVALFPKMLELDDAIDSELQSPSENLRSRILAATEVEAEQATQPQPVVTTTVLTPLVAESKAVDDFKGETPVSQAASEPEATAEIEASTIEEPKVESESEAAGTVSRPQGRIRSGVQTVPGQPVPTPIETLGRAPRSWLVAASLAAVAVGAIILSLALWSRVDDQNSEINAQSTALADLRERANATAFQLQTTVDGSEGSSGTLYYSLAAQRGVLEVRNLAELPEGQVYQVWYIEDESPIPVPGATFNVDSNGYGVIAVSPNAPTFDTVALTAEPEGGSQQPTTPVILAGSLPGAAG